MTINTYEKDRLGAMTKFIQRLITNKDRWENISDDVADLTFEIANDFGHVITEFDQFEEDFTRGTNFYFYDKPTRKTVKVSLNFIEFGEGEDEV